MPTTSQPEVRRAARPYGRLTHRARRARAPPPPPLCVQTILANPNRNVTKSLELAALPELLGRENMFVSVHDAVSFAAKQLRERGLDVAPGVVERRASDSSGSGDEV